MGSAMCFAIPMSIYIVEQLSSTVPEACNKRPARFPTAREASSIANQGKGWIRSSLVLLLGMESVLIKSKQLRTTALQCMLYIVEQLSSTVSEACNMPCRLLCILPLLDDSIDSLLGRKDGS